MDLLAFLFGISLLAVAVAVTYLWGIKPEREQKKRHAEQIRAELRRQHVEGFRKPRLKTRSVTNQ